MSRRRATGHRSHRRYFWAANRAATYPIGSHFGSGRTVYAGLPAGLPSEGALPVRSAWRVGSSVPQSPIARPSDLTDSASSRDLFAPCTHTPMLLGYALTFHLH